MRVKPGLAYPCIVCVYDILCVDMRITNHVLLLNLLLTLHFFLSTRLDDMRPQPRQLTCCCKTTFSSDCSEPPEFLLHSELNRLSRQFTYQALRTLSSHIKAADLPGPLPPFISSLTNGARLLFTWKQIETK